MINSLTYLLTTTFEYLIGRISSPTCPYTFNSYTLQVDHIRDASCNFHLGGTSFWAAEEVIVFTGVEIINKYLLRRAMMVTSILAISPDAAQQHRLSGRAQHPLHSADCREPLSRQLSTSSGMQRAGVERRKMKR
eukprot:scaffold33995_cov56-Cyclotella_meneghiniana.AAC.5